jgi:hypothetical protein
LTSLKSDKIETTDIDKLPNLMCRRFAKKVKVIQSGEMIGNLGDKSKFYNVADMTAMCKTDCLIIAIKEDVINILEDHKLKA